MRERKYVKFRVNMYDDTKLKIIDRKPERDLIHYVWNRVVILAGKVNLEGELYLSKNIPYNIETLAIEFNRDTEEVKLALDVLIELEMVELSEHNVYIVKNFAKHQNIKVKDKNKSKDNEDSKKNKEIEIKAEASNKELEANNKTSYIKDNIKNEGSINLLDIQSNSSNDETENKQGENPIVSDNNCKEDKINFENENNKTIFLDKKKGKKSVKRKKKDNNIEVTDIEEDKEICSFIDGSYEKPLGDNEKIVLNMSFEA